MQQGLWFLWVLSAGLSAVVWLYLEISRSQNRGRETRRLVTGCELARQILDRHRLHRTSIHPASAKKGREVSFLGDQLLLPEGTYYGNKLLDLAETLHDTVGHLETSKSLFPRGLGLAGRRVFGGGLLVSWGLILGGVLWDHGSWLVSLGQLLFLLFFLLALSSLGKEWEVSERSVSEMGTMELGTDERIRMRRLLKAIRWAPLAEVFKAPLDLLISLWPVKT